MIEVRKAAERGGFDHGWLDTRRTFSFDLRPGRHAWVQAVRGSATVNDIVLSEGDGEALSFKDPE